MLFVGLLCLLLAFSCFSLVCLFLLFCFIACSFLLLCVFVFSYYFLFLHFPFFFLLLLFGFVCFAFLFCFVLCVCAVLAVRRSPGSRHGPGDMSKWDVSSVIDMDGMFWITASFNRDISKWDVSSVTNMGGMFLGATSSKQTLCGAAWVRSKASKTLMFVVSFGSISRTVCTSSGAIACSHSQDPSRHLSQHVSAKHGDSLLRQRWVSSCVLLNESLINYFINEFYLILILYSLSLHIHE